MPCNWASGDYFSQLMTQDKLAFIALEKFVDDLHTDKERTITTFLCHSGSEDFLWGLVRLLGNSTPRVSGNSAYIIGTLAESELGCYRILSLAKGGRGGKCDILHDLTSMLLFDDSESVMNAAGTLGTLAESVEGREWMLSEASIVPMLDNVTNLLHVDNMWTASNAALVLARLCISESGCRIVLEHSNSKDILSRLVQALGVDEAGRGMNAAFAIGRLCDLDTGRSQLLALRDSEKMISSLAKMLRCEDTGASKNACFALSCIATTNDGHERLIDNANSQEVLKTLSVLLGAEDSETSWFAAMTLRTLASQPRGCLKLREFPYILAALKKMANLATVSSDLKEEVHLTLEILKRLDTPLPPSVTVLGPNTCVVNWPAVSTKSGLGVTYQLYEGDRSVYNGSELECEVSTLTPYTRVEFKVRALTEGDTSQFSDVTLAMTAEDYPSPPQNVRVLGVTISQIKVGWDPPQVMNGICKGYYVYLGKTMTEHTSDLSAILSGLTPNTTYDIQVCAATSRGKGERSTCSASTAEVGAHAPSKPQIQVMGRNEVHVTWEAPEVPLGRINRYDVTMNGKVVYSGTDLLCDIRRLLPDTEYTFQVTLLTNEGKFESKSVKKRTAKDEFDPERAPLYQPPRKEEEPKTYHRKRKSVGDVRSVRAASATSHHSCGQQRPRSAGSRPDRPKVAVSEKEENEENKLTNGHTGKTEPRKESLRPRNFKDLSTHRTSASINRTKPDKSRTVTKPSLPVVVSYVSVQGGDDQNLELDSFGSSQPLTQKPLVKSEPLPDRLRRSKTAFSPQHKTNLETSRSLSHVDSRNISPAVRDAGLSKYRLDSADSRALANGGTEVDLLDANDIQTLSIGKRREPSRSHTDYLFMESQKDFLHRTNTFISSHRPGLKRVSMQTPPTTSLQLPDKITPVATHSKFIPMQVRTQPNNLSRGQLMRVNTTLSDIGKTVLGSRPEAPTRSQTQIGLKRPTVRYSAGHLQPLVSNGSDPLVKSSSRSSVELFGIASSLDWTI